MATAFSPDGSEVIQRSIEVTQPRPRRSSESELLAYYETPRCVDFIKKGSYKKVALQFPDELLPDATGVVRCLQRETDAVVFILADTSYGSCCVDEVAAQHTNADSLIHFGRACLSPVSRLPVLYIFGQQPVHEDRCCQAFREFFGESRPPVVVLYDVVYAHCVDSLAKKLREIHPSVVISRIVDPGVDLDQSSDQPEGTDIDLALLSHPDTVCQYGRRFTIPSGRRLEDHSAFYVGEQTTTLTNFMMVYNRCPFYTYSPQSDHWQRETLNVNRALMRRYRAIEQARDARVVGIVAATLGVRDYLAGIDHLRALLKRAGKKPYVFAMGKLNVAKLANFMEVDVFALVACPEGSGLLENREFYRPVVTPFEMELACNSAREWTGEYVTDFRQILPGAAKHVELPSDLEGEEPTTDVSLITGRLRSLGRREDEDDKLVSGAASGAVVSRDKSLGVSTIHTNAREFLAGRSWQGLEQQLGQTPVGKAVEGRRGIAASYRDEKGSS